MTCRKMFDIQVMGFSSAEANWESCGRECGTLTRSSIDRSLY